MEKKLKKLTLKTETISNLSKFDQGMVIGGYDPGSGSYAPICTCVGDCFTWPDKGGNPCYPTEPSDNCGYSKNFDSSCDLWSLRPGYQTCNK